MGWGSVYINSQLKLLIQKSPGSRNDLEPLMDHCIDEVDFWTSFTQIFI